MSNAKEVGYFHVLTFGKHKGKTIHQVLNESPSYIVWLSDNRVLNIEERIVEEAVELNQEDDSYYGIDYYDQF